MEDFNEIENSFDFNEEVFSDIDSSVKFETRYIKPPNPKKTTYQMLKFSNAKKLVKEIDFQSLDRVYCRVNGKFIFGDFIEAFIVENNIFVEEMTIETLSLSIDNVISLETILKKGYVKKLHLIVSDYFFSHERNGLIKFLYEKLDFEDKFQLSVCRTHCKICQFKTSGGKKIVIHGSSNLRSSDNLEQFIIEDNSEMYDFNDSYHKQIEVKFKTINYGIR